MIKPSLQLPLFNNLMKNMQNRRKDYLKINVRFVRLADK